MYPSDRMRSHLKWTTLTDRRRILRFKVIKKCVDGEAPIYLREMFKTNHQLNRRSSRSDDLYLPTFSSICGTNSFLFKGGQEWNSLTSQTRKLPPQSFAKWLYRQYTPTTVTVYSYVRILLYNIFNICLLLSEFIICCVLACVRIILLMSTYNMLQCHCIQFNYTPKVHVNCLSAVLCVASMIRFNNFNCQSYN